MRHLTQYFLLFIPLSFLFSQIPTDGLVAYYPLDGNAMDISDNQIHGDITGPVLAVPDRFGTEGKALNFNGINNFVNVASNSTLNLTQEITISVWVNPAGISDENFTALVNKWEDLPSPESGKGYYLGVRPQIGQIRWNTGSIFTDGDPLFANRWTHLVVTYSPEAMIIYRDCFKIISEPAVEPIRTTVVPFRLGMQSQIFSSDQEHFQGSMDEVLIYNRALKLDEIVQICNNIPSSNENLTTADIRLYPNPSQINTKIVSDSQELDKVVLINSAGLILQTEKAQGKVHLIENSAYPPGVYIVRVQTISGDWYTYRLIMQ